MNMLRISTVGLLVLSLAGCNGDEGEKPATGTGPAAAPSAKGGDAKKPIVLDGSSTVYRISEAASEAYSKAKPDAQVIVNNSGTSGGFGKYLAGDVDIVDASRPAKADEEKKAQDKGMPWTRFYVGFDGITVVVNGKNDFVKSLTVAQLKALWEPDSKVQTWKDLDPSWPDRKIKLYSPDGKSGTFEFFTEAIVGKAKSQRKDVQPSPDDNVLVTGVSGDPDGIGYFGYAYYASNAEKLKAVPIQKGPDAKPVLPDTKTILNKTYSPLSRRLFIYVKNSSMARPEVAEFVKYYLDHIDDLAKEALYVPPTAEDKGENAKALEGMGK